ncbi:hypothetical protein Hypma_005728 [Hypsizygus marmoreus]|uniref:Uncharacterized protein n=1 Tax=Hypsizygus marmoreus TaxID=39966 RepID=A0A369KAI7_HYPMA|nr:hypothetical protein Hypma_005728 [Hypsizygus marmoreus]
MRFLSATVLLEISSTESESLTIEDVDNVFQVLVNAFRMTKISSNIIVYADRIGHHPASYAQLPVNKYPPIPTADSPYLHFPRCQRSTSFTAVLSHFYPENRLSNNPDNASASMQNIDATPEKMHFRSGLHMVPVIYNRSI